MSDFDLKTFQGLPPAETYRRIDFETVEVRPGFVNDTFFLFVSGTKPWVTMSVSLMPLIYIDRPEYWGIEVVAHQTGIGLPQTAPYSVLIDISQVRGTKGIEVLGATKSERYDV